MKHVMLAAVASLALSLPAMAQSNHTNTIQPSSQSQMGSQSQTGSSSANQSPSGMNGNQQAQNTVNPQNLSQQQIRQIQMTLNKKGFDAKRADGVWGPETDAALVNFQQKNNLPGNGKLNQQTLSALGVNVNRQSQQGSATTGAGSSANNGSGQNPGPMNNGSNADATNGSGSNGQGTSGSSSQGMSNGASPQMNNSGSGSSSSNSGSSGSSNK